LQGKYHLELDENATPIVHPPRKVPVAIKERLRNELERLTKMDIIKPVSTPTPSMGVKLGNSCETREIKDMHRSETP
jgi:hypothetical protein